MSHFGWVLAKLPAAVSKVCSVGFSLPKQRVEFSRRPIAKAIIKV